MAKRWGSKRKWLHLGMEKYMKFTMTEKEIRSKKYHMNPYRAMNLKGSRSKHDMSEQIEVCFSTGLVLDFNYGKIK